MRIAIVGTGGIGGYLGGRLCQIGEEVIMIARGSNLNTIQHKGLKVDSINGNFVAFPKLVTDDPGQVGKVDLIILGVKAWQVPEAVKSIDPMVGPDTVVIPVQNSVETPSQLAAILGSQHIVIGLCMVRSFIVGPGHLCHTADVYPNMQLGEFQESTNDRVEKLGKVFEKIGLSVIIPADIHAALWQKFLVFSVASGMGSITRASTGVWRKIPETRQMTETAVWEVVKVGKSQGINLSNQTVIDTMQLIDSWGENHSTSMTKDFMEGRPCELEAAIGHMVRLGKKSGIATPTYDLIHKSLLPQESKARL